MGDKEHIQRLLEKGHSSALRDEIVRYVGNSPKRMKALMHFFFHEKLQYCQRSSWPVGHIGLKYPDLVRPYAHQMIEVMDNPQHDAVVRNILRIYEEVEIPEDVEGPLCDKCFEFIENPKYAVAIRAFALTVLQRSKEVSRIAAGTCSAGQRNNAYRYGCLEGAMQEDT